MWTSFHCSESQWDPQHTGQNREQSTGAERMDGVSWQHWLILQIWPLGNSSQTPHLGHFCHLPEVLIFMAVFQGCPHTCSSYHWLLSWRGAKSQEKMKPILNKREEKNGFFVPLFPFYILGEGCLISMSRLLLWLLLLGTECRWYLLAFESLSAKTWHKELTTS